LFFGYRGILTRHGIPQSAQDANSGFLQGEEQEDQEDRLENIDNNLKDVHNRIVFYANALIAEATDD